MKLKELKTQKEVFQYLKNKYDEVKVYKTLKKVFLFKIFEVKKAGRTLYYYGVFDKKGNLQKAGGSSTIKIVAKNKINEIIKDSINTINVFKKANRDKKKLKNDLNLTKPIKNSKKELNISKRFKNNKELADWSWIWTIIRFGLIHLDSEKKYFEIIKTKQGTAQVRIKKDVEIPREEELIYKIYSRLVNITQDYGIYAETTRGNLLEARFEKLYKFTAQKMLQKAKSKNFFYSDIYHLFYMIMLWQSNVNNKTLDTITLFSSMYLQEVYQNMNEIEELADEEKEENVTWDIIDNSCVFADIWFNENYKEFKEVRKLKIGDIK